MLCISLSSSWWQKDAREFSCNLQSGLDLTQVICRASLPLSQWIQQTYPHDFQTVRLQPLSYSVWYLNYNPPLSVIFFCYWSWIGPEDEQQDRLSAYFRHGYLPQKQQVSPNVRALINLVHIPLYTWWKLTMRDEAHAGCIEYHFHLTYPPFVSDFVVCTAFTPLPCNHGCGLHIVVSRLFGYQHAQIQNMSRIKCCDKLKLVFCLSHAPDVWWLKACTKLNFWLMPMPHLQESSRITGYAWPLNCSLAGGGFLQLCLLLVFCMAIICCASVSINPWYKGDLNFMRRVVAGFGAICTVVSNLLAAQLVGAAGES